MSKRKHGEYVPFDKRSKKKQHEENARKRNDWGAVNPATRYESKNAYKKKKQQEREDSLWDGQE